MKILTFDIEVTPTTVYTWDLWPNGLSHDNIVQEWSIICAAYKYLGKSKVYGIKVKKVGDDKELTRELREVLADADVIIGHNIDKFDVKKFNARLIYHGLQPLPKLTTIDTRKVAKQTATFLSNRLDYLGKHLLGEGKMHVDYQLWLDVMKGSRVAVNKMMRYNKVDVIRNEQLYLKLRPYMKTHPHIGVMLNKDRGTCPKCGSTHLQKRGYSITNAGIKYHRLQCQQCGGCTQIPVKQFK